MTLDEYSETLQTNDCGCQEDDDSEDDLEIALQLIQSARDMLAATSYANKRDQKSCRALVDELTTFLDAFNQEG